MNGARSSGAIRAITLATLRIARAAWDAAAVRAPTLQVGSVAASTGEKASGYLGFPSSDQTLLPN
jgi:hypothetical protein